MTGERCPLHGGYMVLDHQCQTEKVLSEVREERERQFARYGTNEDLEDGTGPGAPWLFPLLAQPAAWIEARFRREYESHELRTGRPTWTRLLREEIAEAFMEDDPARLRSELIQVAALAVSWIEKLDAR